MIFTLVPKQSPMQTLPDSELQALCALAIEGLSPSDPIDLATRLGIECRPCALPRGVESLYYRGEIAYRNGPHASRAVLVALASALLQRAGVSHEADDVHALAGILSV